MAKLYNVCIFRVNPRTGEKVEHRMNGTKMNDTPMSHHEAVTFRSKMISHDRRVVELVEVRMADDLIAEAEAVFQAAQDETTLMREYKDAALRLETAYKLRLKKLEDLGS